MKMGVQRICSIIRRDVWTRSHILTISFVKTGGKQNDTSSPIFMIGASVLLPSQLQLLKTIHIVLSLPIILQPTCDSIIHSSWRFSTRIHESWFNNVIPNLELVISGTNNKPSRIWIVISNCYWRALRELIPYRLPTIHLCRKRSTQNVLVLTEFGTEYSWCFVIWNAGNVSPPPPRIAFKNSKENAIFHPPASCSFSAAWSNGAEWEMKDENEFRHERANMHEGVQFARRDCLHFDERKLKGRPRERIIYFITKTRKFRSYLEFRKSRLSRRIFASWLIRLT